MTLCIASPHIVDHVIALIQVVMVWEGEARTDDLKRLNRRVEAHGDCFSEVIVLVHAFIRTLTRARASIDLIKIIFQILPI